MKCLTLVKCIKYFVIFKVKNVQHNLLNIVFRGSLIASNFTNDDVACVCSANMVEELSAAK